MGKFIKEFVRKAAVVLVERADPGVADDLGTLAYRMLRALFVSPRQGRRGNMHDIASEDSEEDSEEGVATDPGLRPQTVDGELHTVLQSMFRHRVALYLSLGHFGHLPGCDAPINSDVSLISDAP